MKKVLEIHNLEKNYGDFKLLINDFYMEEGQVVGLVGRNGVGKSTTLKSILGLIPYKNGEIKICNEIMNEDSIDIKQQIGYVPENSVFYGDVKGKDFSKFIKNCYKNWDEKLFEDLVSKFEINLDKRMKELSKGNLVKLLVILSVCHHPKLLILDEPTSGLDPLVRNNVIDFLKELVEKEKTTILFSSHIMEDIDKLSNKIAYIDNGSIRLIEKKSVLLNDYKIITFKEEIPDYILNDGIAYLNNKILINYKLCSNKFKDLDVEVKSINLDEILEIIVEGKKN